QRGALLGLSQLPLRHGHRPSAVRRLDRDAILVQCRALAAFRARRKRALLPPSLRLRILRPPHRVLRNRRRLAHAAILGRRLCRAVPRGVAIRARSSSVVGEPRQWRAVADAIWFIATQGLCRTGPDHVRIGTASLRPPAFYIRRCLLACGAYRSFADRSA